MLFNKANCLIAGALLGLPAFALPMEAKHKTPHAANAKAIYFITNADTNSVVAIPIGANGTLSGGTSIATGGKGGSTVDATTGAANGPDSLSSQSSLTVVNDFLFAVNPGSNTLSMMKISSKKPTNLSLVGEPATLPGEFPVTVAASSKNNLVCVGTTGAKAGISCAPFSAKGLGAMGPLTEFALNQTTPPSGPLNTVAQTFFSEDETRLITTVKGDPTKNNTGFVSVLAVEKIQSCSAAAPQDTRSSPNGTAVLFGSTVIPGTSNVFVTDASFGAAVLDVNSCTNEAALVAKQAIADQKATCWAAFSRAKGSVFVTDVANNRLVEMTAKDAKIISTINLSNGDPGLIDLKAGGRFVYALSPGNGTTAPAVTVVDAFSGKQVQHYALSSLGAGKSAQGMAILE